MRIPVIAASAWAIVGVGCGDDGLLLVRLSQPADQVTYSVFDDPACSAPFSNATPVLEDSAEAGPSGVTEIALLVPSSWHGALVRVDLEASVAGTPLYGCVCPQLPGRGRRRKVQAELVDAPPETCPTIASPASDGGDPGAAGDGNGDSHGGDPGAGGDGAGDGGDNPGDPTVVPYPCCGPDETCGAYAPTDGDPTMNSGWIGGACGQAVDCSGIEQNATADPICLTDFPAGMCTTSCYDAGDYYACEDWISSANRTTRTRCVEAPGSGGMCFAQCDFAFSATGCRPEYVCVMRPRWAGPQGNYGTPRAFPVCVPADHAELCPSGFDIGAAAGSDELCIHRYRLRCDNQEICVKPMCNLTGCPSGSTCVQDARTASVYEGACLPSVPPDDCRVINIDYVDGDSYGGATGFGDLPAGTQWPNPN